MLFQPAIIAILLASGATTLMLLASLPFALQVIRRWDISSGSELQLHLERRTYLFSTLLSFVFLVQLGVLLLFVFTADRLSGMFVGAMCAVGSLNVNEWGFPALLAQILAFFAVSAWLAINQADNQAPDYPLVKLKYGALFLLAPLLAGTVGLEFAYFRGLQADVITSCCGSLFSGEAKTTIAEVSAMDPRIGMALYFGGLALALIAAVAHTRRRDRITGFGVAATSALAFVAAISGILSFLSLYIYEHPHHHCPFCILKPDYDYLGYALYVPLFLATASGLGAGTLQGLVRTVSLARIIPEISGQLGWLAALGFLLVIAISVGMIMGSNLILLES